MIRSGFSLAFIIASLSCSSNRHMIVDQKKSDEELAEVLRRVECQVVSWYPHEKRKWIEM